MAKPAHIVPRWTFLLVLLMMVPGLAQQPAVDLVSAHILIAPDPMEETVTGQVTYQLQVSKPADTIVLDAHNMVFHRVALDGMPVAYRALPGKIAIAGTHIPGNHELQIEYTARPLQTVYFIGWKDDVVGNEQIWTQGQGKDTSHWVPVVDALSEKVEFDLSLQFDSNFSAIAGGLLAAKTEIGETSRWDYQGTAPMSSYLLAFAIGRFNFLEQQSASGVPLQLYYPEGEVHRAEYTYRYSSELFDFLEREIGYPFPWGVYRQVPVRDFLYAGMENAGATFFSDRYLVDSLGYNDENYITVNAHELAHQWFGNLVTETDASEHWLHEGFATFYAYQAERHLLGEDHIYWKLFDTARALETMDEAGRGESLLDPGASSLTFYEKGAWALFLLREEVGEAAFRQGVKNFLMAHAYSNARVEDFLKAVEDASGISLAGFRETWLEDTGFPAGPAMDYLKRHSPSVKAYLGLLEAQKAGNVVRESTIAEAWQQYNVPEYRAQLLSSFRVELTPAFLERVCREGSLPVQKAFLMTTKTLEDWMIPMVEGWLDAPSYELREASLFRLWVAVPDRRIKYLDRVSGNGSLSQKGIQQYWWILAALTEGYAGKGEKEAYLDSLRGTTSPAYSWETREKAFSILQEVGALNRENLRDLIEATEHHSWQFRKFARRLLDALLEQGPEAAFWRDLAEPFPRDRYRYVHQKIDSL
ncbi:M1 family metallopeptidase [Robiginitalea marina]|uniref:Aminopeptidase N n=1 Tax=Robiginitalea marina TaxID=2954105 RepID=A0ABT1AUW1_9FLAO|nr:M1 family metallopeptidase [Robiginitalea marina]MCO5723449.1 M1 family metallopeptidase [Robiginitalea marina]